MAIRDVIQGIQAAIVATFPPGISSVTPSAGATGVVAVDSSSTAPGTYAGVVQVLTSGAVGTATAQVSLDGGANYGPSFTIPPQLSLVLDPSQVLSGLVLNFSGSFTALDSYSFTASGSIEFQLGEEWLAEQSIFPRVVWIPLGDDFSSATDYSLNLTNPKSLYTASARFEAHCWGIDRQRAELLRDQVLNGFRVAAYGMIQVHSGDWTRNGSEINTAGRAYVISFSVPKPVTELAPAYILSTPPFVEVISEETDHADGTFQTSTK